YLDEQRVRILVPGTRMRRLKAGHYHFILFPHSAICLNGANGFVHFLAEAQRLLRIGGHLVFTADVPVAQISDTELEEWYPPTNDAFWTETGKLLGLELDQPFSGLISRASIDRGWERDEPTPGMNYFVNRNP